MFRREVGAEQRGAGFRAVKDYDASTYGEAIADVYDGIYGGVDAAAIDLLAVILGGLDSLPGTIIAAFAVGILESVVAGYIDPIVGGGFSHVASYLVLIATLFVRPWGLFGRPDVERV